MSLAKKDKPLSLAHRKALSAALKGREFSEEHRLNLSLARQCQKPKKLSVEHRAKVSAALKGRVFSKEHRRNLSLANKRRYGKV
jgi:hypothetical protein